MKHILNIGLFLLVMTLVVVLWSIKIEYSL
jgi:hypothetical protein